MELAKTSTEKIFSPVRSERVYHGVARQLREAILSGVYRTGDRLPPERELIEKFEVSRAAVREAILILQQQGLIAVKVGSGGGVFVADTKLDPILQALENGLALQGVTPKQLKDARQIIEPACALSACQNITDTELEQLRETLALGKQALDRGEPLLEHSAEFHRIIAAATKNALLEMVLVVLLRVGFRLPAFQKGNPAGWRRILKEHNAIYAALAKRSTDEVHAQMCDHLCSIEEIF